MNNGQRWVLATIISAAGWIAAAVGLWVYIDNERLAAQCPPQEVRHGD